MFAGARVSIRYRLALLASRMTKSVRGLLKWLFFDGLLPLQPSQPLLSIVSDPSAPRERFVKKTLVFELVQTEADVC